MSLQPACIRFCFKIARCLNLSHSGLLSVSCMNTDNSRVNSEAWKGFLSSIQACFTSPAGHYVEILRFEDGLRYRNLPDRLSAPHSQLMQQRYSIRPFQMKLKHRTPLFLYENRSFFNQRASAQRPFALRPRNAARRTEANLVLYMGIIHSLGITLFFIGARRKF